MLKGSNETYIGLDLVRFCAALGVAVYHLGYWWWLPEQSGGAGAAFRSALQGIAAHARWGNIGVQIFFVLSGFIIAASAQGRSAEAFLKGRALRLFPAAWVASGILYLVRDSNSDLIRRSVDSLILWPGGPWLSGVFWTLGVEVVFYALVALTIAARWRLQFFGALFGLMGSAFWILRLLDHATGGHFKDGFANLESSSPGQLFVLQNCYFGIGLMLWFIKANGRSAPVFAMLALFIASGMVALFAAARYALASQGGSAIDGFEPVAIWLGAVALIACSIVYHEVLWKHLGEWSPAIRTIGLATYPLYLIHSQLGRWIMLRLAFNRPWISLAVALAAVILAAFAVLALERWPRAALRKILDRRAADEVAAPLP